MLKPYVVVPSWNGATVLPECLDSLLTQSIKAHIIVVENGSTDNSLKLLRTKYPMVEVVVLQKNRGFAGGVNSGIKKAISEGAEYVASFNNDATANKSWLKQLVEFMDKNPKVGIATGKIVSSKNNTLDSTGDIYTIWGLPFPRGRGEPISNQYDKDAIVFGASGGASLYRVKMLEQIGLFDEDFFAYFEDVDLSFRAQLTGWKIAYLPEAVVDHQIGATSGRIKGFATYHTLKNLPLLLWKNVPWALMPRVYPRFVLAYCSFTGRTLYRGQFGPLFKGLFMCAVLWPKKMIERHKIQGRRNVSVAYINSIISHDLPPNAHHLRKLRSSWQKLKKIN